jgi:hypothetical protein
MNEWSKLRDFADERPLETQVEKLLIRPSPVYTTLITAGGLPPGEGNFAAMVMVAFDGVIDLSGAQRGLLRLFDEKGAPRFDLARSHRREPLSATHFESVESIFESALQPPRQRFENDFVDCTGALRSALAVPMMHGEGVCGLVYLDRRGAGSGFPRQSLWPVEWLAQMVAVECSNDLRRTWRWNCLDISHCLGRRVG